MAGFEVNVERALLVLAGGWVSHLLTQIWLCGWMQDQEKRINNISDSLDLRVAHLEPKTSTLESDASALKTQLNELRCDVNFVKEQELSLRDQVTTLREQRDNEIIVMTARRCDDNEHTFRRNIETLHVQYWRDKLPREISQLHNLKKVTTNCQVAEEFTNPSVTTLEWTVTCSNPMLIWKCFPKLEVLHVIIRDNLDINVELLVAELKNHPCNIRTLICTCNQQALLELHCIRLGIELREK